MRGAFFAVIAMATHIGCASTTPPPPPPVAAPATTSPPPIASAPPASSAPPLAKPPPSRPRVAHGDVHTCVADGGTVRCWGSNQFGSLGDATKGYRRDPGAVPDVRDVVDIAAFEYATCALGRSGDVTCWGAWGPFGKGTPPPVTAVENVHGASRIAVGATSACALVSGELRCWSGGPAHAIPLRDVTQFSLGFIDGCARIADGSVSCWTSKGIGQVKGIADAVEVAVGSNACALRRDGAVLCWGNNANGQTSPASAEASIDAPTVVAGIPRASHLCAGAYHACALSDGGKVTCWGSVGTARSQDENAAPPVVSIAIDDVESLTCGYNGDCAVKRDGSIWCWGGSDYATPERIASPLRRLTVDERLGSSPRGHFADAHIIGPIAVNAPFLSETYTVPSAPIAGLECTGDT